MKIALITSITPYKENIRGASALPYHLIIHRQRAFTQASLEERVEMEIFSFNTNKLTRQQIEECEHELDVNIYLMRERTWVKWIFKLHLHPIVRVLMTRPFSNYIKLKKREVDYINSLNVDGIWVYGEEYSQVLSQFPTYKRVLLGPDCESLYYYRLLGKRFVFMEAWNLFRKFLMYPKYLNLEQKFPQDDNITYCVVGEEDAIFLRNVNPRIRVIFLRHPHYEVSNIEKYSFHIPIRLLIAGQNNYYMRQSVDELVNELLPIAKTLKSEYVITFLGRGWQYYVNLLRDAGYQVNHIEFAIDYIGEVRKYDIQLTPITIGTGTKGKVLDALANGLLVIGTNYALENIAVKDKTSCLKYDTAKEVVNLLKDIPHNLSEYEKIADRGRECVLKQHSRTEISRDFFNLFK